MQNNIIDFDTYAVIPGVNGSKIVNKFKVFFDYRNVRSIVNSSCKYYGSSLDGRISGSKEMLGISYKVPIIVSENFNLIFFPTSSPRSDDCVWINLCAILEYKSKSKNLVLVTFKNGKKVVLNISFGVLEKQILRASRLESIFLARKR